MSKLTMSHILFSMLCAVKKEKVKTDANMECLIIVKHKQHKD